jgi:hypothetical protein
MQNEVTGHAEVGIRQSGALTTLTAAMKSSSTSQTINNQGMLRNILAPDASRQGLWMSLFTSRKTVV